MLVADSSDYTLFNWKSSSIGRAWEIVIKSVWSEVVPLWTSGFNLITEAESVVLLEDWWENVDGFDFNCDCWEADLKLSWLSAIASVHVVEPVFSVEFEAWFEIAVINDNIGAVVTVILKVMNGLLDFL